MVFVLRRLVVFIFVNLFRLRGLRGALLAHVEQDLAVPVRRKFVTLQVHHSFLNGWKSVRSSFRGPANFELAKASEYGRIILATRLAAQGLVLSVVKILAKGI